MANKAKEPEVKEPEVKNKAPGYDPNELVEYMAPLLPGRKQKDIFAAVNGETVVVKRGVRVKIKRKFLSVLQNAEDQQYAAYMKMLELQKQGDKPAGNM